MVRRSFVVLMVVLLALGSAPLGAPVAAEPVVVDALCTAAGTMTPRGTVTLSTPFGPITFPYDAIGQPLADALQTTEVPLALPLDVTATDEIEPGGTIDYATGISFDAGAAIGDAVDALRESLEAAGYPEVAASLTAEIALRDLTLPFPHPAGSSPDGTPVVAGTSPVTASHVGGEMVAVVDELVVGTNTGPTTLDTSIQWSVVDGGTVGPATIEQRLGDPTLELDIAVGATIPPELVELLAPDLPIAITSDVPITMGASGPFGCDVGDADVVATTAVLGPPDPTAETLIRVTTTPAVPSAIVVDGTPLADWGLDWVAIEPGAHEVCFGPVTGYATPPCQNVVIDEGQTGVIDAPFDPLGLLQVQVDPAGLPVTIHVDGEAANGFGLFTWIEPGDHEVCWGALDGWSAPMCETVTVGSGEHELVTGAYTEGGSGGVPGPSSSGDLRVTTSPAVPARIIVDGVARTSWGLDWMEIETGEHEVCFGPVTGFRTPPCQTVTVTEGAPTEVVGAFEALGLLQVQVDPAGLPAHVLVDGVVRNRFGMMAWTEPGSYEVCWGPVAGQAAPPCETVAVTAGATTLRTGSYLPAP